MATPTYLKTQPHEAVVKLNYDKAVEGLGKICVEFQLLETNLKAAIGMLLDPNDHWLGPIVTSQLSFRAVLDLFGALCHHRFNDSVEVKELNNLLRRCHKAEARRNQFFHSTWLPDFKGGKGARRRKFTARKKLQSKEEIVSQSDLRKEAEDLRALRDMFFQDWAPRVGEYVNLQQTSARPASVKPMAKGT